MQTPSYTYNDRCTPRPAYLFNTAFTGSLISSIATPVYKFLHFVVHFSCFGSIDLIFSPFVLILEEIERENETIFVAVFVCQLTFLSLPSISTSSRLFKYW